MSEKDETVNHPAHYNRHPSGIEAVDVCEVMSFNMGNAVKYLFRHEHKGGLEDLRKARWYLHREIHRERDVGRICSFDSHILNPVVKAETNLAIQAVFYRIAASGGVDRGYLAQAREALDAEIARREAEAE